jgi:TRAP-type C4-dicarboxylate transport system substrate-binding protein
LKKSLHEHRALFDGLKERQRAIAHNVFQKTSKEKNEIIQKHEQSIDTFTYQAKMHFKELENDMSMLNGMIENFIPLFEQQEVPSNNVVEVPTRVFYL